MDSSNPPPQPNHGDIFTVKDIIDIITRLYDFLSKAELPSDYYHSRTSSSSNGGSRTSSSNAASSSIHGSNGESISTGRSPPSNPFEKLLSDLNYMKRSFIKLKEFENELGKQTRFLDRSLKVIVENMKRDPASIRSEPREIIKAVFNLKCQIPLPHKLSSTSSDASRYHQSINVIDVDANRNLELPNLHMNPIFHKSSAFTEIKEIFSKLVINRKLCLLCFAVFPENAQVKKRLLMYWWIGEGFVRLPLTGEKETGEKKTVEENVKEILKEFTEKGLIYPVNKKRTPEPNSFMMAPLVRSAAICLTKDEKFFDYDDCRIPTTETSFWNRRCLGGGKEASRQEPENIEKLQTLFNVSEQFPDFTFKWFLKMKELKVLCLGRWESTAERHIEVESTEFLKDLRSMKQLRLLSFQGISRLEELHSSICKLSNLTILDLRACYNLEKLPDKIDSLKNLTHLDISECYLLDRMPKKLSSLLKLQVLKGFVISDAEKGSTCTLDELSPLKNLRKLSININQEVFSLEDLISAVQNFKELQSLKVAWGGGFSTSKSVNKIEQRSSREEKSNQEKEESRAATPLSPIRDKKKVEFSQEPKFLNPDKEGIIKNQDSDEARLKASNQENTGDNKKSKSGAARPARQTSMLPNLRRSASSEHLKDEPAKLPSKLQKLDLHCFPETEPPSWLMPENLSLQKLCIRGGKLRSLGENPKEKNNCSVHFLRLKYLSELKVNWMELLALFPKLMYLEKFRCPKISFCPCDGIGVWSKQQNGSHSKR